VYNEREEKMVKLVILINPLNNRGAFDVEWPAFLHLVEAMPGLRRETTSRVERHLFGNYSVEQVHELFFDTFKEAEQAMNSPQGQEAGKLLQKMTGGQMTLFFAEHKEDELTNIRSYKDIGKDTRKTG
jgi:uncharacterized protein (TIGR02118 family)